MRAKSQKFALTERLDTALKAINDQRLRMGLMATTIMVVLFMAHFGHLFLPAPLSPEGAGQDYAAFYGAARAALAGGGALYDPAVFQEMIGAQTTLLWLYPPQMLFLLAPFGLVPYGAAKVAWGLLALAMAYGVGLRAGGARIAGALAAISPASFVALYVGQISALFALLLVTGLMTAKERPWLAGLCFGILTIKPQYGLLVIPFLIAIRAWRAIAASALCASVLIGLSALIYGVDMWVAFFDSLRNGVHAAYYQSGGHPGRITLSDAIKAAGLSAPPAIALYGVLIAAVSAGLFVIARRATTPLTVACTLMGTALVCPYFFVYDYLVIGAAYLIIAVHMAKVKALSAWTLMALWFAPMIPFLSGSSATPAFLWPLTALGLAVTVRLALTEKPGPTPAAA